MPDAYRRLWSAPATPALSLVDCEDFGASFMLMEPVSHSVRRWRTHSIAGFARSPQRTTGNPQPPRGGGVYFGAGITCSPVTSMTMFRMIW